MSTATPNPDSEVDKESFVETALKLSGKSEEEARTTGAVDRADEQVEALFAPKYQTAGSPAHMAVWNNDVTLDVFSSQSHTAAPETEKVMQDSLNVIRSDRDAGVLLDDNNKISEQTLSKLGQAGYWGLLVDRKYGGHESSFGAFARFPTRVATIEPTVAGLASVHGCIGAVDPLRSFGNEQQKQEYLPKLAS
ncbi:MAG: acyl-CoA dehydrogenase family protein, partial [Planctomycetaceae bacterium]